jgi:hypothetical protein
MIVYNSEPYTTFHYKSDECRKRRDLGQRALRSLLCEWYFQNALMSGMCERMPKKCTRIRDYTTKGDMQGLSDECRKRRDLGQRALRSLLCVYKQQLNL